MRRHSDCARLIAERLAAVPGIRIGNDVCLNQVTLSFGGSAGGQDAHHLTEEMSRRLNATGRFFLRTATWQGRTALRVSVTSGLTTTEVATDLTATIAAEWSALQLERRK